MTIRALVIASILGLLLTAPLAAGGDRSVNTVVSSKQFDVPYGVRCHGLTTVRQGNTATASAACRSIRTFERGWAVMTATFKFQQSGEEIAECDAQRFVRRFGAFTLQCSVEVPPPFQLPISLSGTGDAITEPMLLPGGQLLLSASYSGTSFLVVRVFEEDGDTFTVMDEDGPFQSAERIWPKSAIGDVRFQVSAEAGAAWTLTISDAFPD